MTTTADIIERGKAVLIGNYARQPYVMVRGEGSLLWDADGKQFLDLFAGFGGTVLGHCHPVLIEAAARQAGALWAVGNTFWTEPQIELAEMLNRLAFAGQAFYCHSGAEANEAACKLARLRGSQEGGNRWKIISLDKSFHGRTLAMIAATGNPNYRKGFGPEVPGFINVEPGNFGALESAVDDQTCAVLMEPIQGEGGVNQYPVDYVQRIRALCDQRQITLIFDEVWTGCGRTGHYFAHQGFQGTDDALPTRIEPDILTLGKAIGGGLPVGCMFAKPALAKLLVPGTHGSTLGGNPICMAVARAVFHVIERENLTRHAADLGTWAAQRLRKEGRLQGKVVQVRGQGLMIGIELSAMPEKLMDRALAAGLCINLTAQKVIRLAPAINIPTDTWKEGVERVIDLIAAL